MHPDGKALLTQHLYFNEVLCCCLQLMLHGDQVQFGRESYVMTL